MGDTKERPMEQGRVCAPDRIMIVFGWVVEDINSLGSCTRTPAPILSRTYQELSNGLAAFNQALQIADFPFPFPFQQVFDVLLMAGTVVLPCCAVDAASECNANICPPSVVTPLVAFFVTVAFWSLAEISRELESPFSDGPNQLPVVHLHGRLVESIGDAFRKNRALDPSAQLKRQYEDTDFSGMFPNSVDSLYQRDRLDSDESVALHADGTQSRYSSCYGCATTV